jgi:hypothetical protein
MDFGLFPLSGVLGSRNTTFRKLDLLLSSDERGEKTPTQLGPLERANLNHWNCNSIEKVFQKYKYSVK